MIRLTLYFIPLIILFSLNAGAQDNCSSAQLLCANNSITRSTVAATVGGTDPALSCGDNTLNNNVWFIVQAASNGTCTVTVNNINNNPGLDMEVYTGVCGSLVTTSQCASGSSATGGTMSVNFATVAGTQYFIMVDGNAGNQEPFDIVASGSIVARPDANFNTNPASGCTPLSVLLQNTTILHGGTNITYEWKIDAGSFVPRDSTDTTVTFSVVGSHTATLRVCNQECGCKTVSQDIVVQDLYPTISFLPATGCVGIPINFDGAASVLPDPPYVDPNITSWDWDFGDPSSGVLNTASGQSVVHSFSGASPSYSVRLIVQGTCGPDTAYTTINIYPQPVVTITGPAEICEGQSANFTSAVSNGSAPITYSWSGAGSFSCTNCSTTTVSNLLPGGPYAILLTITDSHSCTADTSANISVNSKPSVFAGGIMMVCKNDTAHLNAIASSGTPAYRYQWSPSAGLSNDTISNPWTINTNGTSYCVTVTDSKSCVSDPDCISLIQYPQPTIASGSTNMCASQPNLQNTFTVNGASPGSTYAWGLSPSYFVITKKIKSG